MYGCVVIIPKCAGLSEMGKELETVHALLSQQLVYALGEGGWKISPCGWILNSHPAPKTALGLQTLQETDWYLRHIFFIRCWDPIRPCLSRQDNGRSDATNTCGPSWTTIESGPELDGSVVDFLSTKGDESFVDWMLFFHRTKLAWLLLLLKSGLDTTSREVVSPHHFTKIQRQNLPIENEA